MSQYPAQVARFKLQAKATENIRHENIVQTYVSGESNGTFYVAHEMVIGKSLAQYLRGHRRFQLDYCMHLIDSSISALQYAWETGQILHANLKPENILIDTDGTVKLTDFSGITEQSSATLLSALSPESMGSPHYLAPEMLTGSTDIHFQTDIYSLGAILYHILTGRLPFRKMTHNELRAAGMRMRTINPINIDRNISTAASTLAQKMMIKEPHGRYQSWEAIRDDLASVASRQIPPRGNLNHYESAIADYEPQAGSAGKRRRLALRIKFALIYAAIIAFSILNIYLMFELNDFFGIYPNQF